METKKFDAEKITNEVAEITKFDVTKGQLEEVVKESEKIVLDNPKDILQLKKAKENKKIIRGMEKAVEDQGKGFRDIFTKLNKNIMTKQRELTDISGVEIARLDGFLKEAKELEIREERLKVLPFRQQELEKIGNGIEISDDEILAMSDEQFDNFLFAKKEEAEEEAKREQKRKDDIAQAKIDERKNQRIKRLRDLGMFENVDGFIFDYITFTLEDIENVADDIFDVKVAEVSVLIKKKVEAQAKIDAEEKLANDKKAEDEAKAKAEADAKAEAELTASREDFKKFRKELGWTEETKDQFINREITKEDGTTVIELFKKVGEFKK